MLLASTQTAAAAAPCQAGSSLRSLVLPPSMAPHPQPCPTEQQRSLSSREDAAEQIFVPPWRVSTTAQHLNLFMLGCTTLGLQGWEISGAWRCNLLLTIAFAIRHLQCGGEESGDNSSLGPGAAGRGPQGQHISLPSSVSRALRAAARQDGKPQGLGSSGSAGREG